MKTYYYRYTLQGELSATVAQSSLGEAASQGIVVRMDHRGGQTHVYIASHAAMNMKASLPSGVKAAKVSEKEVTKIG
jgi:hypothetical protein